MKLLDKYELRNPDEKLKNVHKLEHKGHSNLFLLVYLSLVQMHLCIKYEGSMINHAGRAGRYSKFDKWRTIHDCTGSLALMPN